MSWWTKNRKKVAGAGIAALAATGVGAPVAAALTGLLGAASQAPGALLGAGTGAATAAGATLAPEAVGATTSGAGLLGSEAAGATQAGSTGLLEKFAAEQSMPMNEMFAQSGNKLQQGMMGLNMMKPQQQPMEQGMPPPRAMPQEQQPMPSFGYQGSNTKLTPGQSMLPGGIPQGILTPEVIAELKRRGMI